MKNILDKIRRNILIVDLIFMVIFIGLSFFLYLVNIRFRLWFDVLIILIFIICFIVGLIQIVKKNKKRRKEYLACISVFSVLLIIIGVLYGPFIFFLGAFSYSPEHTVTLGKKRYVAVVNSFLDVDVNYYDYLGPFLMGTKVRVNGYFGSGGYDPFVEKDLVGSISYTYYDKNGKVKSKVSQDKDGNSIDNSITNQDDININTDYKLPEDEKVLYEKKFNDTILRFAMVDSVLGQNILVNVLRSTDKGKNFYVVSDNVIQVSREAKFIFLNENLGFAISTGHIRLSDNNGLYVTTDSGKTFSSSKFYYTNSRVEYMNIDSLPYFDGDTLKIKCSIYDIKKDGDFYETVELVFTSKDNGLNWVIEK